MRSSDSAFCQITFVLVIITELKTGNWQVSIKLSNDITQCVAVVKVVNAVLQQQQQRSIYCVVSRLLCIGSAAEMTSLHQERHKLSV